MAGPSSWDIFWHHSLLQGLLLKAGSICFWALSMAPSQGAAFWMPSVVVQVLESPVEAPQGGVTCWHHAWVSANSGRGLDHYSLMTPQWRFSQVQKFVLEPKKTLKKGNVSLKLLFHAIYSSPLYFTV